MTMGRFAVLALLGGAFACGGSTAGTATSPDGGGSSDSGSPGDARSASDAFSTGAVPVDHRPSGAACPQQRAPGMLPPLCNYDAGSPEACLHDSDCTQGNNGRCMHPDLTPAVCVLACSYDECFTDSDCPASVPCTCRASATESTPNTCVGGSGCRVDADCGPGGYCSPSAGYGSFQCGVAYFCHTANDTCVNDTDCDAAKCQYDSAAGHWRCGGPSCAPPP
jgi:hypothetical protein